MDELFEKWAKSLIMDFSDIGILYQKETLAVSPLHLSKQMTDEWATDLPKLFNLARKVALNYRHSDMKPRADLQEIAELFIDSARLPGIMRPDCILVGKQLKILELNVESSLGGIWEIDFMLERIKQNPLLEVPAGAYFPNPKDAFLKFINELTVITSPTDREQLNLAIVGFSDYDRYNEDVCKDMCEWITLNTAFNATYTRPELMHVKDSYMTDGLKLYDVIYKFGAFVYPPTQVVEMVKMIKRSHGTKTIVLNDPTDIFIEHKGALALLSRLADTNDSLVKEDVDLINKYIPWSRFLQDDRVKFQGKYFSTKQLALDAQDELVLKRTNSCLGDHVFIGKEVAKNDWQDMVAKALNDSDKWIIQENLSSALYDLEYYIPSSGRVTRNKRCVFSPFIFGNHFGGVMVRVEKDPNKRVLALPTNSELGAAAILIV